MPKVTLIGTDLANKDDEFIFLGPLQECKECKLTHICFNLKPFHRYKIQKVRKKRHSCNIHENNATVVEVKEQAIITSIDKKFSKGSTINIKTIDCDEKLCLYYDACISNVIKQNQKYKIKSTLQEIDCPKGNSLQIVEVVE